MRYRVDAVNCSDGLGQGGERGDLDAREDSDRIEGSG